MNPGTWFFRYGVYYPVVFLRREWVPFYLRRLQRSQYLDAAEIRRLQEDKLRSLVAYAAARVPYYRRLLRDCSVHSLRDLEAVPTLEKEVLRSRAGELTSEERFLGCALKTTGGSTGAPVTVRKTHRASGSGRLRSR